jgi:hypothetical protein
MKRFYIIILLFVLVVSQLYAQSDPTAGLKEIPLTGLSTGDGYRFHFYSSDGKLNTGFSEVFIALTDTTLNFVDNFTVSEFRPLFNDNSTLHSTPVGQVEKVSGKALYKTWFSFLNKGTWSLSFNYTIDSTKKSISGSLISSKGIVIAKSSLAGISTTSNDTITQTGWFIDRDCVAPSGTWNLPHTSSCGIDCSFPASDNCWNSGLGVFIYNPNEFGQISRDSALTDKHYLLLDAQSKELTKAFLLSLPDSADGEISVKVKGYWNTNGISSNKTKTQVPELITDSINHYLKSFHLYSIEGIYINNLKNSFSGFGTTSYKLVPADLAPKNVSAVNFTGGTTVKFTPPGNVGNVNSNLTGYKVRVYNNSGVLQPQYTTITNDTTTTSIDIHGLTSGSGYYFTVTALYPGSAVEAESAQSNTIGSSITGVALTVSDYSTYSDDPSYKAKWIDSFNYNNETYYLTLAYPQSYVIGIQTIKAYINKKDSVFRPYQVVNGGFRITQTPVMPSMGHSSSGNTQFSWNATDSIYKATIHLSMEGGWRIGLKVYDAATDTLVAGTDISNSGTGNIHYWDLFLGATTGIKDISLTGISIYPTISKGNITINSPSDARVKVIDYTGSIVGSYQLSGTQNIQLNVPAGLYFISVESSGKTFVQKVIVKN